MQKKLTKGNNSNYEIQFTVDTDERQKARKKVIKVFWKDIKVPGFREWHVPADIIEKQINPEYIKIWVYEELINNGLQEILKENPKIRFIGQPYDINHDEKDDKLVLTVKLDVFPEIEITNDKRKKEKIGKIAPKVEKEEVTQALTNLKKNYAEYKDTDKITEDTVSKIAIERLDKDSEIKDKWHIYVGEPEFKEFNFFKKTFLKQWKKNDIIIDYKEKDLPPTIQYTKSDQKDIKKIKFIIKDIKKIVLPKMTEETLKKLFGPDSQVKNEKELETFIKNSLIQNKVESELIKEIENYLQKTKKASIQISIPKTLIEEEQKVRIKNLQQKFGSQEKVEEYFKQIWEEKTKAFLNDIKKASKDSLEKFFTLQKICELLELNIDRNNNKKLQVEKLLYTKLSGEQLPGEETTKTKNKTTEKKTTKKTITSKKSSPNTQSIKK